MTDFEKKFSSLLSLLNCLGKVNEVSKHFGPSLNAEDMFRYLWNLPEAQEILSLKRTFSSKCNTTSEDLRSQGNIFYKKGILSRALDMYSQSIAYAEHPEMLQQNIIFSEGIVEDVAKNVERLFSGGVNTSFKSLYLGYSNRSAVLFELRQYKQCIYDIQRCLAFPVPVELLNKLLERFVKCLVLLGYVEDARKFLLVCSSTAENVNKIDLSSVKKLLALLLSRIEVDFTIKSKSNTDKYAYLFEMSKYAPKPLVSPNQQCPSMSSSVMQMYNPQLGRHLVASKDILPGEVLVLEKSFASVLLPKEHILMKHCSLCLHYTRVPVPCISCPQVVFCSETCRDAALHSFHHAECRLLSTLTALDMGKNAVLAFRIVLIIGYDKIAELVSLYNAEKKGKHTSHHGLSGDGKYDSSDYRTVYNLVTNQELRTVSDLFKRCAMAVLLVKVLMSIPSFFTNSSGEKVEPIIDQICIIGTTLFHHLMNMPCNAHSIVELMMDWCSRKDVRLVDIGAGVFPVLSLVNHSCNPTATRICYGSVVELRSTTFIPKGGEITDSYGEYFALDDAPSRQVALEKQYLFKCNCDACTYTWKQYSDLPDSVLLLCVHCRKLICLEKLKCTYCGLMYNCDDTDLSLGCELYNAARVNKKILYALDMLSQSRDNPESYKDSEEDGIQTIFELLTCMQKYTLLPSKGFCDAQEFLRRYFQSVGGFTLCDEFQ